ncbi:efflux RND transporter periplasmic adaptor subunit [Eilatimonas milleporae]|uniref:RND family efflux transporter MFP subunit n=1 Tax=Eilatimonas milleporae TaxID=911205 RepID=A0A3M0D009_9PROT|nr:efflux RND transporter periplasmic adaptor subunit [Eilatimonas milleporae]RMB13029.1 RND family efflux transporter MFP subunit [Eilatimonas milleporae]
MSNQKELLSQLKIDRNERASGASGGRAGLVIAGIVAVLLVGGGAAWWVVSDRTGHGDRTVTADAAAPRQNDDRADLQDARLQDARLQDARLQDARLQDVSAGDVVEPRVMQAREPAVAAAPQGDNRILNASGYITARRIATVSAEITGLIKSVLIEEGMGVSQGQVLARLDDAIARADYNLANARVVQARTEVDRIVANLSEAERDLARATELRKNDFATEARVTQAQADLAALKAQLANAEASVDVARYEADRLKERLDDHTIRAPFDGVVTVKAAQPGEIVSPVSAGGGFTRTGICTIVDMTSLEIEVDVNEAFIGRVFEGQTVLANLDAYPSWDVPAEVIAIIPTANRDKATVRVRIAIGVRDDRILPDMGVKVAFLRANS